MQRNHAQCLTVVKPVRLTGARVRLLHVVDEMPFAINAESDGTVSGDVPQTYMERGDKILAQARAKVEQSGIAVDTVLFESLGTRLVEHVVDQVNEWGADLIVLGTHGRRGVGRLLMGSDAEQVVRAATVPVLLVRAKEPVAALLASDKSLPARTQAQAIP